MGRSLVPRPRAAPARCQRESSAAARARGLAATSDDARRRRCHARARPRPLRLLSSLPGLPRHNSTTMDSGLSSAYSSAYSSAQSSAYSSLANTPRELTQAEARDATRDHRLAPSGRDHLSQPCSTARAPAEASRKRNRELKGRPRVRRTGGGPAGPAVPVRRSGSSRGSPAGSPLRRHGSVVKFDDSLDELFEFEDRPYHNWRGPRGRRPSIYRRVSTS